MARVEVITGPERRRRWTEDQKRAIVAASLAPGAVVNEVARRAEVCPGVRRLRYGNARDCAGFRTDRAAAQISPNKKQTNRTASAGPRCHCERSEAISTPQTLRRRDHHGAYRRLAMTAGEFHARRAGNAGGGLKTTKPNSNISMLIVCISMSIHERLRSGAIATALASVIVWVGESSSLVGWSGSSIGSVSVWSSTPLTCAILSEPAILVRASSPMQPSAAAPPTGSGKLRSPHYATRHSSSCSLMESGLPSSSIPAPLQPS